MSITVQNNSRNLSSIYKYNNFQNTKAVFSSELAKTTQVTNNTVPNVAGVKYSDDAEQTLIEDKKLYDSYGFSDVEFGSAEWNQWKIDHTDNFFPPLDAPAKVRQAWREVKESIPKDDKLALHEFTKQNMFLACSVHYADTFDSGLPKNFKLSDPQSYEELLNIDIKQNNFFSEICAPSDKNLYIQAVKLDQQLKNKLHEVLFSL